MPSSPHTEEALLTGARSLDSRTLGEIHDRYYPEIYRYALYRTSDADTAADIAGEVFLRLINALHAGRAPQATLRGWLFAVASHLVVDHFRRAPVATLSESLADSMSVPTEVEAHMRRGEVQAAMRELTREQQEVLALRFGDGFSVEETAAAVGKSVPAVKALQFRALEALRRLLKVEYE